MMRGSWRNDSVSIHALLAECDQWPALRLHEGHGFNPRTPCGVRLPRSQTWQNCARFQSTHSLRSATVLPDMPRRITTRFNPRTPCGVRQHGGDFRVLRVDVSIHALLAECDSLGLGSSVSSMVSIHALLAECDNCLYLLSAIAMCFNPRTPCGVRLRPTLYIATQQSKSYFAPTSLKRPSLHGCSF